MVVGGGGGDYCQKNFMNTRTKRVYFRRESLKKDIFFSIIGPQNYSENIFVPTLYFQSKIAIRPTKYMLL